MQVNLCDRAVESLIIDCPISRRQGLNWIFERLFFTDDSCECSLTFNRLMPLDI